MHPAPSLIRQFAAELDEQLETLGIRLINGQDQSLEEIERALEETQTRHHDLLKTNTTKGILFTKIPFCTDEPITPASPSEIMSAHQELAEITIKRKKSTCMGLSAVVLAWSIDLIAEKKYNKINVQICQLQNWSHTLIRITHSSKHESLFYDPWFQRCHTSKPKIPKLFAESEMAYQMEILTNRASTQRFPSIRRVHWLMPYDPKTKKVREDIKSNDATDFSYCMLCSSSGTFLNPGQVVAEPSHWNNPDLPALCGCIVC